MFNNSAIEEGFCWQISSKEVSCSTTNAGTPCSFAIPRRHSRKYSRSSASVCVDDGDRSLSEKPPTKAGRTGLAFAVSHFGLFPQTSQEPHDSHFGVSPKCVQIWRWRHRPDSAKARI